MSAIPPSISFPQVANFIGQLNHDLRNHLNAIELQSAFLGEIVAAEEAKAEVRRLREMTGEMGAQLQRLSRQLAKIQVHTMSYTAADLGEDLRTKINTDFSAEAAQLEWQFSLGKETLEIDPQLLLDAFAELFANAFTHSRGEGPLIFAGRAADLAVVFSLREPKSAALEGTADWGRATVLAPAAWSLCSWPLSCAQYFRGAPWHLRGTIRSGGVGSHNHDRPSA